MRAPRPTFKAISIILASLLSMNFTVLFGFQDEPKENYFINPKKFKAVYAFAAFQYSIGSLLPPSALNAK